MMKRPILWAATAVAVAVIFLIRFSPELLMPSPVFSDGESIVLYGTIQEIQEKKGKQYLFLSDVYAGSLHAEQELRRLSGETLLPLDEEDSAEYSFCIGNRLRVTGTFQTFRKARNEGNYDEENWYYSTGVFFKVKPELIRLESARVNRIRQSLFELRKEMVASITATVPDDETAGILAAICTGDRSLLTEESRILYQNSGIAHILAISGLHISLIGMTVFRLLRKRLRFCWAAIISGMMMLGFCIMSSASASSVRAAIMFLVQMGSIGLGKNYDMTCSLSLAAILMLIFHPMLILNTGFQLSFAAVLGASILYPALEIAFRKDSSRKRKRRIRDRLLSGFLMSLSVTLAALPVMAAAFYEIPLYAILANVLVVPLMSVVLGAGMASAVLGMISVLIGRFFAASGVYMVYLIRWICELTGKLPGCRIVCGAPASWRILIYYGFLMIGVKMLEFCKWKRYRFLAEKRRRSLQLFGQRDRLRIVLGTISWLLLAAVLLFLRFRPRNLRIFMLDVGQGESILLESPSGTVYMIDCGSVSVEQTARYRVSGALHYLGIERIDYLILTHPDRDHMSGIIEILESRKLQAADPVYLDIGTILTPSVPENDNYLQLKELAEETLVPVMNLYQGLRLEDGALSMTCLYPDQGFYSADSNAYSAVMDIRYQEFSMLATGDLGQEGEELLLGNPDIVWPEHGYTLLKVGHHGSSGSSSEAFLRKVSPLAAIISAGSNNPYGHPHKETLERLRQVDAFIFCTGQSGEILIQAEVNGSMRVQTNNIQ